MNDLSLKASNYTAIEGECKGGFKRFAPPVKLEKNAGFPYHISRSIYHEIGREDIVTGNEPNGHSEEA
jgi:hypothetical protein